MRDRWQGDCTPEESPAYRPQANGAIERAIRSFKEQRQCMLLALEERLQTKLPSGHAVQSWLTEFAGTLLRRKRVGMDDNLFGKSERKEIEKTSSRIS